MTPQTISVGVLLLNANPTVMWIPPASDGSDRRCRTPRFAQLKSWRGYQSGVVSWRARRTAGKPEPAVSRLGMAVMARNFISIFLRPGNNFAMIRGWRHRRASNGLPN